MATSTYSKQKMTTQEMQSALATNVLVALSGLLLLALYMLTISATFSEFKAALPEQLAWHFSRGTAVVSYLMLTGSVWWGLALSTKIAKRIVPAPTSLALHSATSWSALILAGLHAVSLLFDTYFTFNVVNLLVPLTGPYRPFWVGIGIGSFYMMFVLTASYSYRSVIGQKNWRLLHFMTFPLYFFVTLHGVQAGTDTGAMLPIYIIGILVTLGLTAYRIIDAVRR